MDLEWTSAKLIREGIVGINQCFETPFGKRKVVYADWTASGRALAQVEDYIRYKVLPLYANTHTETSITGAFTTSLREHSREVIAKATHCTAADVVMFTGNGSTAAINDFVKLIEVEKKCVEFATSGGEYNEDFEQLPLVLISSYEHHSNILPWRECGAQVLEVPESPLTGAVDLTALEKLLVKHQKRKTIIGSFSAGSNVTGICSDVKAIAVLLHRYGALACFDYACVAPYVDIEMNWTPDQGTKTVDIDSTTATTTDTGGSTSSITTEENDLCYLDAVYISAHKFTGGVGATGLLVAKRRVLTRQVPVSPGGGTVLFVSSDKQTYLDDIVSREEAGTPNIIGGIRAGLAFQIKDIYKVSEILKREEYIEARLRRELPNHPNLIVLGPPTELVTARMPIISFLIKCGNKYLHHNFVSVVLNDVYGIQTRSGCMCAGPYASRLFGLPTGVIDELSNQIYDMQYLKPGFIRLSLVYFNSNAALDFIIAALLEVAEHAWKLLPQYRFDAATSNWLHNRSGNVNVPFSLPTFSLNESVTDATCIQALKSDNDSGGSGSGSGSTSSDEEKNKTVGCDANVMSHVREYYSSILSQSSLLYQSCHALYTKKKASTTAAATAAAATTDSTDRTGTGTEEESLYDETHVPDYETQLYSGARSQYAWFVYPRDVLQSARHAAVDSDWVYVPSNTSDSGECFIKPELYWPHVCQRD